MTQSAAGIPSPHHQDAEFQKKDIERLLEGNSGIGGSLSEYEITQEADSAARPRRGMTIRARFLVGRAKSVRDWWEDVAALQGDIRIYTNDEDTGWVQFRVRLTNGLVQNVVEIQRDR